MDLCRISSVFHKSGLHVQFTRSFAFSYVLNAEKCLHGHKKCRKETLVRLFYPEGPAQCLYFLFGSFRVNAFQFWTRYLSTVETHQHKNQHEAKPGSFPAPNSKSIVSPATGNWLFSLPLQIGIWGSHCELNPIPSTMDERKGNIPLWSKCSPLLVNGQCVTSKRHHRSSQENETGFEGAGRPNRK